MEKEDEINVYTERRGFTRNVCTSGKDRAIGVNSTRDICISDAARR